jgi:hypothetical protein
MENQMTQIYTLKVEVPTKLFPVQRFLNFTKSEDASAFREYIKSIGGKVTKVRIDELSDLDRAKEIIDYEVRECNRVAGGSAQ